MEILVALGKVSGIAGIAVGLAVIVFRDVIRKNIFPQLPKQNAYRLLRLIVVCAWSIAVLGLMLWQVPTIIAGNGNTVIRDVTVTK